MTPDNAIKALERAARLDGGPGSGPRPGKGPTKAQSDKAMRERGVDPSTLSNKDTTAHEEATNSMFEHLASANGMTAEKYKEAIATNVNRDRETPGVKSRPIVAKKVDW